MPPRHSPVSLPRFARVLTVFAVAVGFAFVVSAGLAAVQEQDAELLERGRTVYTQQCASCHGQEGRGDGSAARFLDPKPRDFTAAQWEHASEGPVEAIAAVVANGIDDTAMTPFSDVLSEDQINAVASYVVKVLVLGGGGRR